MTLNQRAFAKALVGGELSEELENNVTDLISAVLDSRFFSFPSEVSESDGLLRIDGYGLTLTTEQAFVEARMTLECTSDEHILPSTVIEGMLGDGFGFSHYDTAWSLYVTDTDYVLVHCHSLKETAKEGRSTVLTSAFIKKLDEYILNDEREESEVK